MKYGVQRQLTPGGDWITCWSTDSLAEARLLHGTATGAKSAHPPKVRPMAVRWRIATRPDTAADWRALDDDALDEVGVFAADVAFNTIGDAGGTRAEAVRAALLAYRTYCGGEHYPTFEQVQRRVPPLRWTA